MSEDKRGPGRPKTGNSLAEKEMDKAQEQFDAFDDNIKSLTQDRMSTAPKLEVEPQTKIAQRDMDKMNDLYLKPNRTVSSREKFNEKYRAQYEFDKEYVKFIAEHKELIGESIDVWTKPYPGLPAEWWVVPTNKPLWAPRYVAEQIRSKSYHRLVMKDSTTGETKDGKYYGQLVADTTVERLTANPVSQHKSVFMGANNF